MKFVTFCFVAHICFCSFCEAATTQEDSSFIVEPVGEEGFTTMIQFLNYDKDAPLGARTITKEELGGSIQEKIVFTGVNGDRVPGIFAIPQNKSGPYPVVLLLHGFTEKKENWWEDNNAISGSLISKGLIAQGTAVLALDAQYHGERRYNNDYTPPLNILTSHQWIKYRNLVLQTVVDYRKAVDYLTTRTEVDTSRIGVMGYSMGGVMTFMLTASDSRIKVGVACVPPPFGMTILRKFRDGNVTEDQLQDYAKSLPARTDVSSVQNYAHAIGSRPFLMIMAARDEWYTVNEARQLYDLVPSPVKELKIYDSGHSLPPEYTLKATQWFESYLK